MVIVTVLLMVAVKENREGDGSPVVDDMRLTVCNDLDPDPKINLSGAMRPALHLVVHNTGEAVSTLRTAYCNVVLSRYTVTL